MTSDSMTAGLPGLQLRKTSSFNWVIFAVLGILVCLASGLVFFAQTEKLGLSGNSFSVDEPGWIAASYYYTDLVKRGDLDWEKWNCAECGSGGSYGSLNMHLGEWLMGVPLMVDDQTKHKRFAGYYDVDRTLEENIQAAQVPPADILLRARSSAAFFGMLCCLLVFAIGFWVYNLWVGLIGAALVMINPVVIKLSGQAMTDTFYNFFLLGCCLLIIGAYKTTNARRVILLLALAGVATGLACSVKVTGLVVGMTVFTVTAGWLFYVRRARAKEIAASIAAFFISALLTVYLLNPLFWPSPRQMDAKVLAQELGLLSHEVSTSKQLPWTKREDFLADSRYPQLRNLSHVMEFPLLFFRWRNMMDRQGQRGWQGWQGPRLLSLSETLVELSLPAGALSGSKTLNFLTCAAEIIFAGVGIVALTRTTSRPAFAKRDASFVVPLMCFAVNYLFIAFFMKLSWDRYYLPTLISAQLMIAVGVYVAVERLSRPLLTRFGESLFAADSL